MTVRTVAHELGHNFGVHHASTLTLHAGRDPRHALGELHGHRAQRPFSIMGAGGTRHHTHWHRGRIGRLPEVLTVTPPGACEVPPAEVTATCAAVTVVLESGV